MSIVITFVVTTAMYGGLAFFLVRWVIRKTEQYPEKMKMLAESILIPLFSMKPDKKE
jgi:hypothetical protein